MKKLLRGFTLIICFIIFSACSKNSISDVNLKREVKNPKEGVYYSLFVRSFADSDGDGIGDLKGLTAKLDYLNDGNDETHSDLGVTGLWLLPIFASPSYHGYDVSDYYSINPQYGTMEDFEEFIAQANKRGIAVILDLTCNHSSNQNPWFIASKNKEDPHRLWYYWLDDEEAVQAKSFSLATKVWGHSLWNKTETGYYAGLFDKHMPDFNLAESAVRDEFKNIARFWLGKGVAGFRLDAAAHVFNRVKLSPSTRDGLTEALDWWQEFSSFCKSINPDSYLIGEVWSVPSTRAEYFKGLDSNFHFGLGDAIIDKIKSGKAGKNNFAHWLYKTYNLYSGENPEYIDAPFLSNHDQNRIAGRLKCDTEKLKLAASMYILNEGIPFIYYGEELAMVGTKPDEQLRTPFLWGAGDMQTSWIESKHNENTIPMSLQIKDNDSLLVHYQNIIRLKTGVPALLRGRMEPLNTGSNSLVSYCLKDNNSIAFVVHNISKEPVKITLPDEVARFGLLWASNAKCKLAEKSIELPAYASAVLVQEK